MTPTERILTALEDCNCDPKGTGQGWQSHCPAHNDRSPSLSIGEGAEGRALIKCHAGCSADAICEAIGLHPRDLMPPSNGKLSMPSTSTATKHTRGKQAHHRRDGSKSSIAETYDYCDECGVLLLQVVRYEPKGFRQRRPMSNGNWTWSVKGVQVIPYRLPELLAKPRESVFVVEGEKDVDNLASIDVIATCNAGGAGKWTAEHAEFLRGRHVIAVADNDDPGRDHGKRVATTLHGVATSVRILELPKLLAKSDISDWLTAGGTKDELIRLAEESPLWAPELEPWPEIISFNELNLPFFPTHALPPVLRQWVEAESHATQTPADLAGLLALAVCSALIARRVTVQARPSWSEPTNLFTAILLEPGNRKSQVFSDAASPLRELEAEQIEAARPVVARKKSELRQDEARLQRLEKRSVETGDTEARHDAATLAAELAEQVEPVLPRLIINDATTEKVGIMLAEQEGRIASMSAEGNVFDLMAGRYSKNGAPQFDVYLKAHAGDELITDRVSRESVRVERPALTCAYAIQPQVIRSLAANSAFRGRGLLGRFLYAIPRSRIGSRKIDTAPVPSEVAEAYRRSVRSLAETKDNTVLSLAPDASRLFVDWETEVESMLAEGGPMESMRDWGAKLAGATLRLAGVLHCVEHGPVKQIGRATIDAAIQIARYLVPHAEATMNMMQAKEAPQDADAQYVLRWIVARELQTFTRRDAHQHGRQRFPKADDIDPGLSELVRRGYIRLRPPEPMGPGRPPSPSYDVNPSTFANARPEKRPQYTHNSLNMPLNRSSEDIEEKFELREDTNRMEVKDVGAPRAIRSVE